MQQMSLKRATIYNCFSKYGTLVMQICITAILARLIAPEEHGVVSLIMILLTFFNMFSDFGLGITIIQKKDMERRFYNQLFTVSIITGLCLVVAMCVIAFPVSILYSNKEYIKLCPIASIVAFFNAINTVPNALLTRDKRFDIIAIRTICCTLISGGIAVILAYKGGGAWALILQAICSSVSLFIWNYVKYPLKPEAFKVRKIVRVLGRYSLFQMLFNFLNYFARNLDNLVIGAKFGEAALGYYNKAYSLNLQPNTIFTSVITGVLHPFIRDYKDDFKSMANKMVGVLKILSLAGTFVMPLCFWCADEIILIMFGIGWETAAACFKMLAICIWAQMLLSVAGSIFLGLERTDYTLVCGIINLVLVLGAVLVGIINESLVLLSLAVGVAYNFVFIITYYILLVKGLHQRFGAFIKHFIYDVIFAFGFMLLTPFVPISQTNIYISILIKVAFFGMFYLLFLIASKQVLIITNIIKQFFAAAKGRGK